MADFDIFIKNFEELCFKKKQSPSAVCTEVGLSTSAYSYWKKEKSIPRAKTLQRLADYLGVSAEMLITEQKAPDVKDENVSRTFGIKPGIMKNRLPIYGIVCAGDGEYALEDLMGYEYADEQYTTPEYYWLKVTGDSMSPRIDAGDLVLVHKQEWIDDGQIGIFIVGDLAYVKKIEYYEEELNLISFNPYYPPLRFTPAEVETVHVIGRVIESKRKY